MILSLNYVNAEELNESSNNILDESLVIEDNHYNFNILKENKHDYDLLQISTDNYLTSNYTLRNILV